MERIGTGDGVVAILNGRAKGVTPRIVRLFEKTLPAAVVLVSEDLEQARRHVAFVAGLKPALVLSGGGDGTAAQLLTMLRAAGVSPFPAIGLLRLGTGNGWACASGAGDSGALIRALPRLPRELPTELYDLVEVDGRLSPFAGLGWDARVVNDYLADLDRRSGQLFGSRLATRLHKSLAGYVYSMLSTSIPGEINVVRKQGPARLVLENLDGRAWTLDERGKMVPCRERVLYAGPVGVVAAGTEPMLGFAMVGFPHARARRRCVNVRVYGRSAFEALRSVHRIWRGKPVEGFRDFFVSSVRMRFSRPMPFQIGGDAEGWRESVEIKRAREVVRIVDWPKALELAKEREEPRSLALPWRPLELQGAHRAR